jgi:hypothetical protein
LTDALNHPELERELAAVTIDTEGDVDMPSE